MLATTALTLGLGAMAWAQGAPVPNVCAPKTICTEVREFAATISDFRVSLLDRGGRMVTATIKFQNKSNRPLVLGYVAGSAVATDDQGNRYATSTEANIRGIGVITERTFDPKFVLQPGETGDGRIEMAWRPAAAGQLFGTRWALEASVRAIDPVTGNQFRLGKEFALQFRGLTAAGEAASAAGSPEAPPPAAATPLPSGPVAPVDNPCGNHPRCFSEGPFLAEVTGATASVVGNGRHHLVELKIRFRNLTSQPIALGYQAGTGGGVDNNGNRYGYGRPSAPDGSVKGIGLVTGRSADPQFVLSPGESRTAAFSMIRFNSGAAGLGMAWTYEAAIAQLEVLPGNQVRTTRQYSMSFKDISTANPSQDALQGASGLLNALIKPKPKKP
jgi:hypothetical protein